MSTGLVLVPPPAAVTPFLAIETQQTTEAFVLGYLLDGVPQPISIPSSITLIPGTLPGVVVGNPTFANIMQAAPIAITFDFVYTPPLGSANINPYNFGITIVVNVDIAGVPTVVTGTFNPYEILIGVVCVVGDTKVLMADGSTKEIKTIERGELVAADPSINKQYRVANLNINNLGAESMIDICEMVPNSIDKNIPSEKLLISSLHPIIDFETKKRRHAHKYVNYPGITRFQNVKAADILTEYCLYDLQFETVGSYVANGVTIQSRNPRSFLTPLPQELYFNQELYDGKLMDDNDPANEFPLDYSLLTKPE